jgi:hypothetical protein
MRYASRVAIPVMHQDVIGGGGRKSSRPPGRNNKRGVTSQLGTEGSGGEGGGRLLITKPTASGMNFRVLYPIACRGLPCISTITELAKSLNMPDWKEKPKALQKHKLCPVVEISLLKFCSTALDEGETLFNGSFARLMDVRHSPWGWGLQLNPVRRAQIFIERIYTTSLTTALEPEQDSTYCTDLRRYLQCKLEVLGNSSCPMRTLTGSGTRSAP